MVSLDQRTQTLKSMIGQREAGMDLSEDDILAIAPTMPNNMVNRLEKASREFTWEKNSGVNDKVFFERKFEYIAKRMYMETGTTVLERFMEAKPIVESSALWLMNTGDVTGNFRGSISRGNNQFDITSLGPEAWGESPSFRNKSVTAGENEILPDEAVNGPETDEEVWVILGYSLSTDPTIVENYREYVSDEEGLRHPTGAFDQISNTDLPFLAREEPLVVFDDHNYGLKLSAIEEGDTDFFPVGVRVATHDVIDNNAEIGSFTVP